MAATLTGIADVLQSQAFKDYVVEQTTKLNAFINSGIMTTSEVFNNLFNDRANLVELPSWKPLSGDSEVMKETAMTPGKITGDGQIAAKIFRVKAWGYSDLAVMASGDNLENTIRRQLPQYWNTQIQESTISVLNGLFASGGALETTHLLDKSDLQIDSDMILDGRQLLGDASDKFKGMVMHSMIKTRLDKLQLIDYIPDANNPAVNYPTYMGYRVIVDDSCPVNEGVYSTYLFGEGALAFGTGRQAGMIDIEVDRDKLSNKENLITRKGYIIHPMGMKWKGTTLSSTTTPTNIELATANKWAKVYDDKNIPIVCIKARATPKSQDSV